MKPLFTILGALCFVLAIALPSLTQSSANIQKQPFGKTPSGEEVYLYTLKSPSGMTVKITNYGGAVNQILVPDRNKKFGDVVLGFDSLEGYLPKNNSSYFGALIGRYANRIANGRFTLDGKTYQIPASDTPRPNSLHGGKVGFDKRIWQATPVGTADSPALDLHYTSADGEEGFPGTMQVDVQYSVVRGNSLRIEYRATTDKPTVLNLTNHSYFNLEGSGSATVLNHKLTLMADKYTPVNANLIPTGAIDSVAGTPFDFRKATAIGARINDNDQQLAYGKGYDHNFVLNGSGGNTLIRAAKVEEPTAGRVMEVWTTQPGIQFYSGNFLDGKNVGIGGPFRYRSALCLETQHFPDSPNHTNFPSTVLRPGQEFHSVTEYRFSTE
ncbi:MAG TPA: aldose epimerase family protein [Bryobacteraceae bacterium]|nr:aldose epimerase family protein [Bryobacteraceae bacterium]